MKASHFYNDAEFSYLSYWQNRRYEHQSEEMAIKRLLGKKNFGQAADIGGGYGRLTQVIAPLAKKVHLIEPSDKMREAAVEFLQGSKNIDVHPGTADKTGLDDNSLDLLTMFRVLHHIPDLQSTFKEVHRVLKPGGYILIEFANSLHFKARLKSLLAGKPIMLLPVERRSPTHIKEKTIDFVNHHPDAVFRQLNNFNFTVERVLSVSNLRFPFMKRVVPTQILLVLEYFFQILLSSLYFGPSIFILARKLDK